MENIVYILRSCSNPMRTYCGVTNNPNRRIRQHNGKITGGAKYTKMCRPWKYYLHVVGFPTRRDALRFEWHVKHHRVRGKRGIAGRIASIKKAMENVKFINLPLCILKIS